MSNLLLRSSCLGASLIPRGGSHFWSSPKLFPVVCQPPIMWPQANQNRGAKVKAGAGAAAKGGKGGGKGGAMVKIALEVETDAKKLVSQVCGANYVTGTDPILIKEDSEYPDWLWTLNVDRPLPPLEEQDPNTKEYWLQVQRDMKRRRNKLNKLRRW